MELGLAGRGENAEIVSFVGRAVESELSGNMIDLCPVGALTSEPFRYRARTWELSRRKSISPHDGLGSNLVVQVKQNAVMRVLPLENEAVNECWLSDKERFSYEALNSPERLQQPMIRRDGQWREADWQEAIDFSIERLKDFAVLASPHSTLEELFLVSKLGPSDFRLRHCDFSADGNRGGIPWLGMPVSELDKLDRVLVVGSFLRKDHPLLAHRLRQAAKRRAQIHMLHSVDDDWLMPIASKKIVPPSEILSHMKGFADILRGGKHPAVLLGNFAQQHPQAAQIHAAAQALAQVTNAKVGFLGEAANSVGGYLAGLPAGGNLETLLQKKSFVLLNAEPECDFADPRATLQAMQKAEFVVQLSAFKTGLDYAHVLLPVAAFTESAGTFVNTEGRVQSFHATVKPLGEARPAWKVLRVLGSLLGRPEMALDTIDQVRQACLGGRNVAELLSNEIRVEAAIQGKSPGEIQRVADVPIYFADPLVRRSPPLQETRDAQPPKAWMGSRLAQKLGVSAGQPVLVNGARLAAGIDEAVAEGCVRVSAAHRSTAAVGPMFGTLSVEKVAVGQAA
jgi:NADH-quinone oxidoreductase subunit G